MKPKKELVRIVRDQDGRAAVDLSGKRSGRGAYLCLEARCVEAARKQRRIERSLEVADCAGMYEELRALIAAVAGTQADSVAVAGAQADSATAGAQAAGNVTVESEQADSVAAAGTQADSVAVEGEQAGSATAGAQAEGALQAEPGSSAADGARRLFGMLGLSAKKGSIESGSDACECAARDGKACLLILAKDASIGTKQRFARIAESQGIACIEFGKKAELGRHVGKSDRSVLAVMDMHFTQGIIQAAGVVGP